MKTIYFMMAAAAFAIPVSAWAEEMPEELYVVGTPNFWTTPDNPDAELVVLGSEGDGIYKGTVSCQDMLEFKIFSAKCGWDKPDEYWGKSEYGSIVMSPGVATELDLVNGYDGFNISIGNWKGGSADLTVDWNTKKISILTEAVSELPETLRLAGTMNDWNVSDTNYLLQPDADGSTIYEGTFDLPAGEFEFKIVTADNWDENYGGSAFSLFGDADLKNMFLDEGGENLRCLNWAGGKLTVTVDYIYKTISFNSPGQPALPAQIRLVGAMNDWNIDDDTYKIEKADNFGYISYNGSFNIPEGQLEFKVLYGDTWDDALGGYAFELWSNRAFNATMTSGGDNFACTNWEGGQLFVYINPFYNQLNLTGIDQPAFQQEEVIYLIGSPQDWNINSSDMKLVSKDGDYYTGSFEIEPQDLYFRFYTQLGDWDNNSIGAQVEDSPIDIVLDENNPFSGDWVWGKGSWHMADWAGGILDVELDMKNNTVKFTTKSAGIDNVSDDALSLRRDGDMVTAGSDVRFAVYDAAGRKVAEKSGSSISLSTLRGGVYVVVAEGAEGRAILKVAR